MSASRRQGDRYVVASEELERFRRDGYVHLEGVLSDSELAGITEVYDRFLRREIEVAGKDFCDMSGDYTRRPEEYSVLNVMLPRKYHVAWQGNIYERRVASIAEQLCGEGMTIDYDQLLAKRPYRDDAVFHWHQDMAYWPLTADPRTASFCLPLDDTRLDNGCLRYV